jgi:hypothetical protein
VIVGNTRLWLHFLLVSELGLYGEEAGFCHKFYGQIIPKVHIKAISSRSSDLNFARIVFPSLTGKHVAG